MSNYSNNDIDRFSAVFSALSNPHRLQIFSILSGCCTQATTCSMNTTESCCVGDLGGELNVAASTLSHHLSLLVNVGLIDQVREGRVLRCWPNFDLMQSLTDFLNEECCLGVTKRDAPRQAG